MKVLVAVCSRCRTALVAVPSSHELARSWYGERHQLFQPKGANLYGLELEKLPLNRRVASVLDAHGLASPRCKGPHGVALRKAELLEVLEAGATRRSRKRVQRARPRRAALQRRSRSSTRRKSKRAA